METPGRILKAVAVCLLIGAVTACDAPEERAAEHLERARALAEDAPAKASLEYRNALRLDPKLDAARFEYAKLLISQKSFALGLQELEKLTASDEGHVEALMASAEVLLLGGENEQAREKARRALKVDPDSVVALGLVATADYRLGELEAAREHANAALAIDNELVSAILVLTAAEFDAGDVAGALKRVNAAIAAAPDDVALNLVRLRLLGEVGDTTAYQGQLRNLIDQFPDEPSFRIVLAKSFLAAGDDDGAIDILRQAADAPGAADATLALVEVIRRSRGEGQALEELKVLSAASPDKTDLIIALAATEFGNGDRDMALDRLFRAARKEDIPASQREDLRIARASLLIQSGDMERAEEELGLVLASNPASADALKLRGRVRLGAGDTAAALSDLNKAASLRAGDAQTLSLLSLANSRFGNPATALDNLSEATIASGYAPQLVGRYVAALLREGRADAAESVLGAAFSARGDQIGLLTSLGRMRLSIGDWAGAELAAGALRGYAGSPDAVSEADRIIAMAMTVKGEMGEAATALEEDAIDGGGVQPWVLNLMVDHYLSRGDSDRAIVFVETLLRENPEDVSLRIARARIDAADNRRSEAFGRLEAVLADEPGNVAAISAQAKLLVTEGRREEAVETLRRVGDATMETTPELRFLLAVLLSELAYRDKAISEYEALLRRFPGSAAARNNLAEILVDGDPSPDDLAKALSVARELRDHPNAAFRETYGWVLYRNGETAAAREALTAVSEALSGSALAHFRRGVVNEADGHTEEALRAFLQAAEVARKSNDLTLAEDAERRSAAIAEN